MTRAAHQKVTADHLQRDAYLYVRQSTVRQVFENTESQRRQYALRERAVALGWPVERIIVIDADLGHSAAESGDREGFQQLVAEVGMGRAGIVLGLEVSRLARNSSDWHRLLEICSLTDTLILDEDGLYDPSDFNDRLLLGLKGTMSEAELHVLRSRLRGGILNQARRGALKMPLPVGLVHDPAGKVVLDPDRQVREALRHLFETFARTGSASATVKHFREQGLLFPRRPRAGTHRGKLLWDSLRHSRVLRVLHNPRYAGAFCFGRTRTRKKPSGGMVIQQLPRGEWMVLIPDAHPGYISWEQFESNLQRLRDNARAQGTDRKRSPPREGPALLQGLVLCGFCGRRMTVRYHTRERRPWPDYVCQREGIETGTARCQSVPGWGIDKAIGTLLVETITPLTLEVALQVQAELEARDHEAESLRQQRVQRLREEATLAQRRFMEADPGHRLVADVLEAEWNEKLRALHEAQEELEQRRAQDQRELSAEQREEILALATDFPRLWNDPKTPSRDRKRLVRLIIDDVTLTKHSGISLAVRFRGGATQRLELPAPVPAPDLRRTPAEVITKIDALLDHHTEGQIAAILNNQGVISGTGKPFHQHMVRKLRREYRLKARYDRLREAGLLTLAEMATVLSVSESTVKLWRAQGLVRGCPYNDKLQCLYEHPGDNPPVKSQGRKLATRRRFPEVRSHRAEEVQYEA